MEAKRKTAGDELIRDFFPGSAQERYGLYVHTRRTPPSGTRRKRMERLIIVVTQVD